MKKQLSRGLVVLDMDLYFLTDELRERNIRVLELDSKNSSIKATDLLTKRILITRRPDEFITMAHEYEVGIISIKNLSSNDAKEIASLISAKFIQLNLWPINHGWLLTLKDNDQYELIELLG